MTSPERRNNMSKRACLLALFTLLLPGIGLGQIDMGSIVGTIWDQSGAVIPGASVTVTNEQTGVSLIRTSDSAGAYQATALIPGTYSVAVDAKGFVNQAYHHITINVQSRVSLNFTLSLGTTTQVVTVSAPAPLLETESATVGEVVAGKAINDLPLNGRVSAQLVLLEPGVSKYYSGPNETADRFSIDGNSEMQNNFILDGVDNNTGSENQQENSMEVSQPPPDALAEFRVQTRTYSAEFGTSAAGFINAALKSGTNQLHGDVWEFLRNNDLDSNTFFNNANGVPIGHFDQNQYGGTLGGPILRNKTFFFVDFQGTNSSTATTQESTVPTPLMKQGNFTELPFSLSAVVPGQTGCIVGNIIQPTCTVSVAGSKLLNLYPNPNIPSAVATEGKPGSWTGAPNYIYPTSVPFSGYSMDVRIDDQISSRNSVFGSYSLYRVSTTDAPWTSNPLVGASNFAAAIIQHFETAGLSWTDTISNSMVNQARVGFNREYALNNPPGNLPLGVSDAAQYGLNGIPSGPFDYGLPPINIGGIQTLGGSPWRPQMQISQVFQLLDSLTWLKGKHSLKFGYQFYRFNNPFLDIEAPQGDISASGIYTNNRGFGVADFLLGDMSSAAFVTPLVPHDFLTGNAAYAQDSWRATPKLTLNYGLRYELFSPNLNHQNQISNFTPANGGGIVTVAPNASGWYNRALVHPVYDDFAPRLGVAYHPLNRLVLRAGYGIYYQHHERYGSESMMNLNPPFLTDVDLTQSLGSTTPQFMLDSGFPFSTILSTTVPLSELQIRAQDPNQPTTSVQDASAGFQVQISKNTVFEAEYAGNFARHMGRIRNLNQGMITGFNLSGSPIVAFPYPNLNNIPAGQNAFLEYLTNDGNVDYNALGISLRRTFSAGLSYGISYTWSHNMANFNVPINGNYLPQNAYNIGAEMANNTLDTPNRLVGNVMWALPVGQGGRVLQNMGRTSNLIGGWQFNAIATLQSGNPFALSAPDESFTGPNHNSTPDCVGNPLQGATNNHSDYVGGGTGFFINPAAFAIPAPGTFGNCAPYGPHGPGYEDYDLSLFKGFHITESKRVEFRAEFFNAFNSPNFGTPSANIANPGSFGKVYYTIGIPRQIQFALKLYF
jgi:hypothetical protein